MALISFLSNIGSLQAQRRLSDVTESLSSTAEKLSSGQRINRASDDAAGLAVADALRVQSRLYSGALRNINDGISLLNVIDGTLSSQSNILTRLSELAEQSANGVFSSTQRRSLDNEYRTLLSEFSRLADSTSFNGLKPLLSRRSNGSANLSIQAGIDGALNSLLRLAGSDTGRFSGVLNPSMMGSDGELDPQDFSKLSAILAGTSDFSSEFSNAYITQVRDGNGTMREVAVIAAEYTDAGTFGSSYTGGNPTVTFHLLSRNLTNGNWEAVHAGNMQNAVGADTSFNVQFDLQTGRAQSQSVSLSFKFMDEVTGALNLDFSALEFRLDATAPTAIDFTTIHAPSLSLQALDITRNRLNTISSIRGEIGALMSRLNTAAALVSVNREGTTAAESRIRDVDVASEAAKYASSQILQNVAASILAQANQQPKILLDILRDSGLRR